MKKMQPQDFNVVVMSAVTLFLCGLIGTAISLIISKKNEIVERTKQTRFYGVVNVVSETIDDILLSLEDTLIAEIKAATIDGKITAEEIDNIVAVVKERIGFLIADKIQLDVITDFIDDWDEWLETKIRATIVRYTKINHNEVS
jgi:hypothetical protein